MNKYIDFLIAILLTLITVLMLLLGVGVVTTLLSGCITTDADFFTQHGFAVRQSPNGYAFNAETIDQAFDKLVYYYYDGEPLKYPISYLNIYFVDKDIWACSASGCSWTEGAMTGGHHMEVHYTPGLRVDDTCHIMIHEFGHYLILSQDRDSTGDPYHDNYKMFSQAVEQATNDMIWRGTQCAE